MLIRIKAIQVHPRLLIILFLSAATLICGATGRCATAPSISDSAIHQMLVNRVNLQHQATGIVVGIAGPAGNKIISYGMTSRQNGKPVNGNTIFGIGSITKVFTALLLSEAAQNKKLGLNDPVSRFLPLTVSVPRLADKRITVLDLATQTSGLPLRPTNLESDWNQKQDTVDQMVIHESSEYAGYNVRDLYQFLSDYKLNHAPGTHYQYSNVGYGLLAIALARAFGTTYPDLIRRLITNPLDMHQTREQLTLGMTRRLATGYLFYGGHLISVPREKYGSLQGAAALYSSANDLLKFLDAVLAFRKTSLHPAMESMITIRRPGGMVPPNTRSGSIRIAMAWNIYLDGAKEIVWKNGSVSGYRSFIGYDPKSRIGVVALSNGQSPVGVDDIGMHILDPRIPVSTQVTKTYKGIVLNKTVLERYVGTYRYSPTDSIKVSIYRNHLKVKVNGTSEIELFAYAKNKFFMKVLNAQIAFKIIKNGKASKAIWYQDGQTEVGVRVQKKHYA